MHFGAQIRSVGSLSIHTHSITCQLSAAPAHSTAHRAAGGQCSTAGMLSRLPVMQPIDSQPEATPTTGCDATEPEAKRTKRSEEHNPFAVFQEVRSRRSRQPKTPRRAELRPCRSQIRDTLDAHRQRETKWTTDAEPALLIELWGRMARREARTFDLRDAV